MPMGFATLMGYSSADLVVRQGLGAGGAITTYTSDKASTAVVPELPQHTVSFKPTFVPGSRTVLWGRKDFMLRFNVTFMEAAQHFSILPV